MHRSDSLAVLHKLVSLLRPGWEIRLCAGGDVSRCMLCRPSEDDYDCASMVEVTGHRFDGAADPQIPLWLDDLDGFAEAGILLPSESKHRWSLASKLPTWS